MSSLHMCVRGTIAHHNFVNTYSENLAKLSSVSMCINIDPRQFKKNHYYLPYAKRIYSKIVKKQ